MVTIVSLSGQCQAFLQSLLLGAALALCYELLTLARWLLVHPRWVVNLEDLLFWLGVALVSFGLMLQVTRGSVRWYVVVGEFLGAVLYVSCDFFNQKHKKRK